MGQSPFAKGSGSVSSPINRRRSTRVEFVAPIIITGRDASGQPFREATETIMVSAHGASFKTRNQILIGMQLMVENLLGGATEKAICIRVMDAEAGHDQHVVAIQLVIPQNIWGMNDPPADWQHAIQSGHAASPSAPAATPGHVSPPVVTAPAIEVMPRAPELAEAVLQALRQQAAAIVQEALKDFATRLKALESEAEVRTVRRAEKADEDAQAALEELRGDFLVQIATHTEQSVAAAEANLREKFVEMFVPRTRNSPDANPSKKNDPDPAR